MLQYSPRNMFLSPVGELSRNEKKCFLASFSLAPPLRQCYEKNSFVETVVLQKVLLHLPRSVTTSSVRLNPTCSFLHHLLIWSFYIIYIFWTCSPNCSSWAGGWALVAEVWSHTLFSTCATRQQMLCSLLLFSTAQFWLLYFSRCWICLVSIQ